MKTPFLFGALLSCIFFWSGGAAQNDDVKKVVCYYGSWAAYLSGNEKFEVDQIDPFLCSHLVYAFLGLNNVSHTVEILDERDKVTMKKFTELKKVNPNLRTLVAVGGWAEGSGKYSKMAMTPANRRIFINSVLPILEEYGFDGLDLDWEYPAVREGTSPIDKQNFVHLVNELRDELKPRDYLLTAAVAAGWPIIEKAYDIPALSAALDYISVMTYDFHGAWENFTGHHSPLGGNPSIDIGNNATFNTIYAVNYWLEHGAERSKLIVGVPIYGRGFVLEDPNQHGLYAPTSGAIQGLGYIDICNKIMSENWEVVIEPGCESPYAFHGPNWIGYDNPKSVAKKARWIHENGFGGGMVWAIESDDYRGHCHNETFPIIKTLSRGVRGERQPAHIF